MRIFRSVVALLLLGCAPAWGSSILPVASDGSLGPLQLSSGFLHFNTDFTSLTDGARYSINGVAQSGFARQVLLPMDSGGIDHPEMNIFVWDFTEIDLGLDVTVAATGSSPLVILAGGAADWAASVFLNGASGENGQANGGGGGGAGGGVFSLFAADDLTFSGAIYANGGNGGLSFQGSSGNSGGLGGSESAGGGGGGDGGGAVAGGRGGNGANGSLVGFQLWGATVGYHLAGGGGGGGGGYNGGPGGGGASFGGPGNAGAAGTCNAAGPGGAGGSGAGSNVGAGGLGGGTVGNPGANGGAARGAGAGGGGGRGGDAPGGTPGGAGGPPAPLGGGGGGGGGGDLCGGSPGRKLDNGGGGSGGGSDGNPGDVIAASVQKSGGGGGGGTVYFGSNAGILTYGGVIETFGGTGPSGNGGDGALKLIAPDLLNIALLPGGMFNGVSPLSLGSNSYFISSLSSADYLPAGGAGGGGAGGSGLPTAVPEPGLLGLFIVGGLLLHRRRISFSRDTTDWTGRPPTRAADSARRVARDGTAHKTRS